MAPPACVAPDRVNRSARAKGHPPHLPSAICLQGPTRNLHRPVNRSFLSASQPTTTTRSLSFHSNSRSRDTAPAQAILCCCCCLDRLQCPSDTPRDPRPSSSTQPFQSSPSFPRRALHERHHRRAASSSVHPHDICGPRPPRCGRADLKRSYAATADACRRPSVR